MLREPSRGACIVHSSPGTTLIDIDAREPTGLSLSSLVHSPLFSPTLVDPGYESHRVHSQSLLILVCILRRRRDGVMGTVWLHHLATICTALSRKVDIELDLGPASAPGLNLELDAYVTTSPAVHRPNGRQYGMGLHRSVHTRGIDSLLSHRLTTCSWT